MIVTKHKILGAGFICWLQLFILFDLSSQSNREFWIINRDIAIENSRSGIELKISNYIDDHYVANVGNNIVVQKNDKILFYTDGVNVYNPEGSIVFNGMGLRASSEPMATCVITHPTSTNQYYIFTMNNRFSQGNRIRYSVVYDELDSLRVDNTLKSIFLEHSQNLNYVVGAYNKCSNSYWLLSVNLETSELYAFQLTDQGINPPIISKLMGVTPIDRFPKFGGISYNIATSQVSIFNRGRNQVELYKLLDNGQLEHKISLPESAQNLYTNTAIFSHDGLKFFVGELFDLSTMQNRLVWNLYVYDLTSQDVNSSKYYIGQSEIVSPYGNLIYGLDKNIYYLNDSPNRAEAAFGQIKTMTESAGLNNKALLIDIDTFNYVESWGTIQNPVIYHQEPTSLPNLIVEDQYVGCLDHSSALLESISIDDLLWSTGDTTTSIAVDQPGIYTVEAVTEGCTVRDTIEVLEADDCPIDVNSCNTYLPNAISLSSMRGNDSFMPVSNCELEDYRLEIYDRWGGRIYQSTDPSSPWDGTSGNYEIQSGVYSYAIRYRYNQVDPITFHSGTVTVVR